MTVVLALVMLIVSMTGVMFMELLGTIRSFEFMAFAGYGGKRGGHEQQGEKFHRDAS